VTSVEDSRPRSVGRMLTALALLAVVCGCGTPKTVYSRLITVTVTMPGVATVAGESCSIDQLHVLLREQGIARHDRLEVMLPRDGQHLYGRIRASLLKGGYRSVRYKLPKQKRAYVTPEEERRLHPPKR